MNRSPQVAETGDHEDDNDKLTNDLPREIHCKLVQTLKKQCAEWNLLEIWNYDEAVIRNLTSQGRDSPIVKHYSEFKNPCFVTCVNYALCRYS
jgi:hypothetical protein